MLFILFYWLETSHLAGSPLYKPALSITIHNDGYHLTWSKFPYPAYYQVHVNGITSDRVYGTFGSHWTIPLHDVAPLDQVQVEAKGLFSQPLGQISDSITFQSLQPHLPEEVNSDIKPVPTSNYGPTAITSSYPIFTWQVVEGAVYYELELLDQPPENPNGIVPSQLYSRFVTREVYTNGYQPNLTELNNRTVYWRVRALDYYGHPLGVFSDAVDVTLDPNRSESFRPLPNMTFNANNIPTPLYPVYSWIPVWGAKGYEVELLSEPETTVLNAPSPHRIDVITVATGNDCYDEKPRINEGTYYWRVRGLSETGQPLGEYSESRPVTIDYEKGRYAAIFGDSISHGGGAISYSPGDWEYSYETYLQFPYVNLAKSGDTSETMVNRFDHDVLPFKPKYLIILGGSNSLRGGVPASQVIHELTLIRDKCLANQIRPIFLTLPPINPDHIMRAFNEETVPNWREQFDQVNSFIRQQRYFIDIEPFLTDSSRQLPEYYGLDGLHPDIPGKRLIGQVINANWKQVTR